MRRITTALVLALSLAGCGSAGPTAEPCGAQVRLVTVNLGYVQPRGVRACTLLYQVVDVIADPASGMVDKATGQPLTWPAGYTAWRDGSEVELLDFEGKHVLTTGGRYWMSSSEFDPEWVICDVRPCPDCELGRGAS